MTIIYVGNFYELSVGEPEIAAAFEELGHKVIQLPESTKCAKIAEVIKEEGAALLLFAKFRTADDPKVREEFLRDLKIPSVCWLFDLYWGL